MANPISPDVNGDDRVTSREWYNYISDPANADLLKNDNLELTLDQLFEGSLKDIQGKLSGLPAWAGNFAPSEQLSKELNLVKADMDVLLELIEAEQVKDQINQQKLAQLQQLLRAKVNQFKGKGIDLTPYKSAAGMGSGKGKGSVVTYSSPYGGPGGPKAQGAGAQAGGPALFPPSPGWGKAQTGGQYFNSSTYLQSMAMQDNVMSAWQSINKNTNRGKQLMMLFFYFARNAESGDMGAMYQFMKFITYIISKDKAKQQIEMGKKLIQLQELSRKWTSKLLNVQSNSADPAASNELMKMMTVVKSETDAIATSQKLISQMMEEFAQVVESLTNSTKAALDAHGRILRTVSRVG